MNNWLWLWLNFVGAVAVTIASIVVGWNTLSVLSVLCFVFAEIICIVLIVNENKDSDDA